MNSKNRHLITLGAALEYYDFTIYALLANFLAELFFPKAAPGIQLLETFAVFALGYFIRPIGGLLFSHYGDRFGRKNAFANSLLLMAIATCGIGLLPTYAQAGILSPILLITLRLVQGIAQGGELPCAMTVLTESDLKHKRGKHTALLFSAITVGAILSTLTNTLLHHSLSETHLIHWGWRLPFLLGGSVGIIGFIIRKTADESPDFLKLTEPHKNHPLLTLLKHYPKKLGLGCLLVLSSATMIMVNLLLPHYLTSQFNYTYSDTFLALLIGLTGCSILLPHFGSLADRVGHKKCLVWALCLTALLLPFTFQLLNLKTTFCLISFMLLYQAMIASQMACYPVLLAELFPTKARITGISLCYNLTFSLAATLPIGISYWMSHSNHPTNLSFLLSGFAILTACFAANYPNKTSQPLIQKNQCPHCLSPLAPH